MDFSSQPASPLPGAGTPLREATPDRLNVLSQARESMASITHGHSRDSSVHDKINVFNSLAMQSKSLERKTADAALKRAMLGREEAESEMRRYREEVRSLRKAADEGRERERRVGERLETVMENYGRAKETHAHTQSLWEKEIRRARKETFKSQSTIVKLQEELKSARTSQKASEESLAREKERSRVREQEAFQARYSLVGLQEQLDQALEKLKTAEQERDAFKTLAKNDEDVARIAAEGRLPLPPAGTGPDSEDDEFASPAKKRRVSSINLLDVKSSASSEVEIEELTRLWQWEKQRAERTAELLDFVQLECQLKCCPCAKSQPQPSVIASSGAPRRRPEPVKIADAGDLPILSETGAASPTNVAGRVEASLSPVAKSKTERLKQQSVMTTSTLFVPRDGIFRTVSQQLAEEKEAEEKEEEVEVEVEVGEHKMEVEESASSMEARHVVTTLEVSKVLPVSTEPEEPFYARTPSVDPPAFALLNEQRVSLLSLLDAPQQPELARLAFDIPTTPAPSLPAELEVATATDRETTPTNFQEAQAAVDADDDDTLRGNKVTVASMIDAEPVVEPSPRPHTTTGFYSTSTSSTTSFTTTTKVPLREETTDPNLATRLLALQRTPSMGSKMRRPNLTVTTPARSEAPLSQAITPTMTREQALAQIQERRGRARSAAQGAAVTPRKQMTVGVGAQSERRDLSAPAARSARRVRS